MSKKKYSVNRPRLEHNGEAYEQDSIIELENNFADPLLAVGAIVEAVSKKNSGKSAKMGDTDDAGEDEKNEN